VSRVDKNLYFFSVPSQAILLVAAATLAYRTLKTYKSTKIKLKEMKMSQPVVIRMTSSKWQINTDLWTSMTPW
jgi:hypothetical protein